MILDIRVQDDKIVHKGKCKERVDLGGMWAMIIDKISQT